MSDLEDFGQPGYNTKHWLAITGVEGYKRNGRVKSLVSNNRTEELGRKIGKRMCFSNKT
jgi:hypothetical protein